MDKKKTQILTLFGISVLIVVLVGVTFAYFSAQAGGTTSRDVSVTSNTTDNLAFSISNDISFTVTQADLTQGGNNKSGNATATAILTPNNKTGAATMNYYLYLDLTENEIVYSSTNTNNDPELMLQVYDGNNQLVTLTGLGAQKTIKGVTGYDITSRRGLITLLDSHAISASNNTSTTETWQVVITVINLDVDQNDNTNKEVVGELIISKDYIEGEPMIISSVPQGTPTIGYIDPIIKNTESDKYMIYTVGYITDDTATGVTYSFDIENMGVDFSEYDLAVYGTPAVMITQTDFNNYVDMKTNGLPLTSVANGSTNSAVATAQELYEHSLGANELTINSVTMECTSTKCTATVSESFSGLSGLTKHSTTTNGETPINALYNGIMFNVEVVPKPTYVYWNDNFSKTISGTSATASTVPSGNGLLGTFNSRDDLVSAVATAYSNSTIAYQFNNFPMYIKTKISNNTVIGHQSCYYYGNRELCIDSSLWAGTIGVKSAEAGAITSDRLKAKVEELLGTTLPADKCSGNEAHACCYMMRGDISTDVCVSHSGGADFYSFGGGYGIIGCGLNSDGGAVCYSS